MFYDHSNLNLALITSAAFKPKIYSRLRQIFFSFVMSSNQNDDVRHAVSKHVSVFLAKHSNEYGLKITFCHAALSKVTSAVCLFCTASGRGVNVGSKRKQLQKPRYWSTSSFRVDSNMSHMRF